MGGIGCGDGNGMKSLDDVPPSLTLGPSWIGGCLPLKPARVPASPSVGFPRKVAFAHPRFRLKTRAGTRCGVVAHPRSPCPATFPTRSCSMALYVMCFQLHFCSCAEASPCLYASLFCEILSPPDLRHRGSGKDPQQVPFSLLQRDDVLRRIAVSAGAAGAAGGHLSGQELI